MWSTPKITKIILLTLSWQCTIENVCCSFQVPSSTFVSTNVMKRKIHSPHVWSPFNKPTLKPLCGWVQDEDGEWEWEEDDPNFMQATATTTLSNDDNNAQVDNTKATTTTEITAGATPTLPSGKFRPKQSLGQNYLRDGNTVLKFVKQFLKDAESASKAGQKHGDAPGLRVVELGPGAGALTDVLVSMPQLLEGNDDNNTFQCIEIDQRSVELLQERHPNLRILHQDVLQTDYPALSISEGGPLHIVGNLPYYITSQILFALADASHIGAVRCATVTMQWEVAQRIVSPTRSKDYGILSVVFQLYTTSTSPTLHFKIPPTVFYPQPKVDSALVNFEFLTPEKLHTKFLGVKPQNLRRILNTSFNQRRKTIRNSLKKLALEICDNDKDKAKEFLSSSPTFVPSEEERRLPQDWYKKRPEELNPLQFVELTRLFFGPHDYDESNPFPFVDSDDAEEEDDDEIITSTTEAAAAENHHGLGKKVWRKLKHGVD